MIKRHPLRRTGAHAAAVTALLLVAVGCGDDDNASTSSAPATPAPTTAAPATTDAPASSTATDSSREGEVIKVGYTNNEGDTLSFPAFRLGGEVAIDHINANGGINGATIEVVSCISDGSPESSINCANQFVDEGVTLSFAGIDFGSDSSLPILTDAGIPYITEVAWGPAQMNDANAFQLHAALDAIYVAPLDLLAKLGVGTAGLLFIDTPSDRTSVETVVNPVSEKLGIDVKVTYVAASNVDWTSSVSAAIANGAEALWAQVGDADCVKFVEAARAVEFEGPIIAGNCSTFVTELGEDALGVYTTTGVYLPEMRSSLPPEIQEQIDLYVESMTAADHEADINNGFFVEPFSAWMEIATALRGIEGEITGASVIEALNGATIPGFMGPEVKCGQNVWPTQSSACSAANLVTQVVAGPDGNYRKASDEGFVDLSALVS